MAHGNFEWGFKAHLNRQCLKDDNIVTWATDATRFSKAHWTPKQDTRSTRTPIANPANISTAKYSPRILTIWYGIDRSR